MEYKDLPVGSLAIMSGGHSMWEVIKISDTQHIERRIGGQQYYLECYSKHFVDNLDKYWTLVDYLIPGPPRSLVEEIRDVATEHGLTRVLEYLDKRRVG